MQITKTMEERVIFRLDWATRHLKNLEKQNPVYKRDYYYAIEMYQAMRTCCDFLKIDLAIWLKMVDLPYKKYHEPYDKLFKAKEKHCIYNKPMLPQGYFEELIYKLKGN